MVDFGGVDTLTPEHRSWLMSRIRSVDTKPELFVRCVLHRAGYRYGLHCADLPGRPDVVLRSRRIAIEVRGCFWHHHPGCRAATVPHSRHAWWVAKLRRNSTDPEDIFIAHISGMDALARALLSAADILEKSELPKMLKERYASFDTGEGKRFEDGQMSLEELVAYAKSHGEPATISGKQEKYEAIVALHVK